MGMLREAEICDPGQFVPQMSELHSYLRPYLSMRKIAGIAKAKLIAPYPRDVSSAVRSDAPAWAKMVEE